MIKHIGIVTGLCLLFFGPLSCSNPDPVRPHHVPSGATFVYSGKTGTWQTCEIKSGSVFCQIFNEGGVVLFDEKFLPYDGMSITDSNELTISRDGLYPSPTRITLTNGRILLPRSQFEREKQLLDGFKPN
jgi:hypothetical protein